MLHPLSSQQLIDASGFGSCFHSITSKISDHTALSTHTALQLLKLACFKILSATRNKSIVSVWRQYTVLLAHRNTVASLLRHHYRDKQMQYCFIIPQNEKRNKRSFSTCFSPAEFVSRPGVCCLRAQPFECTAMLLKKKLNKSWIRIVNSAST